MELSSIEFARVHDEALRAWYASEPDEAPKAEGDVVSFVLAQHFCNFSLWNREDQARRTDVDDSYIADVKRAIDGWNQKRNDLIETLDVRLLGELSGVDVSGADQHSETAGMIVDRLSILSLKIWHMTINANRTDDPELAAECAGKLETLKIQRGDLEKCLVKLLEDFGAGRRYFKLYRQFKAYNDARLNPALYKGGAAKG